jgi:hypothetical protein
MFQTSPKAFFISTVQVDCNMKKKKLRNGLQKNTFLDLLMLILSLKKFNILAYFEYVILHLGYSAFSVLALSTVKKKSGSPNLNTFCPKWFTLI